MNGVEIRDLHPNGYLSFDLKDILRCLHTDVIQRLWRADSVECTGEASQPLERLAEAESPISAEELIDIASRTDQVIWGTFKGHLPGESVSSLTIKAIDSSLWEVFGDSTCLTKIQTHFRDVRPACYNENE